MKLKVLGIVGVLVLLTTAASFAGGTKEPADQKARPEGAAAATSAPVKIKMFVYVNEDNRKLPHEYAVSKMKQDMPEIEVEALPKYEQEDTQIKTWAATGNLPEIYEAGPSLIEIFKRSKNIMVLDQYVKSSGLEERLTDSARRMLYMPDGHCYALPFMGSDSVLLFYNKALFQKYNVAVPRTYDELLQAAKVFIQNGIVPLSLWEKETWPGVSLFDSLVSRKDQEGLARFNAGKVNMKQEVYLDAATKVSEMARMGMFPRGVFNMNFNEALALFNEEKAAMFQNGTWILTEIDQTLGEKVDYVIAPFADSAASASSKGNFVGGWVQGGHAVSPTSKKADIAAKWLMGYERYLLEGNVYKLGKPEYMLKDTITPEKPMTRLQVKYLADLKNARSFTCFPWSLFDNKVRNALETNMQKLMTGTYEPQSFIDDMQAVIDNSNN